MIFFIKKKRPIFFLPFIFIIFLFILILFFPLNIVFYMEDSDLIVSVTKNVNEKELLLSILNMDDYYNEVKEIITAVGSAGDSNSSSFASSQIQQNSSTNNALTVQQIATEWMNTR